MSAHKSTHAGSALPEELRAYYEALDGGDDDRAALSFAEDAVYIRPGMDGGGAEIARGRAEIREMFERRSARKQFGENLHYHEFHTVAVDGAECFVEGLGIAPTGPFSAFLAHATLGEDGLIARYIGAFVSAPGGLDE
jgi:ketosteroid isomerase-like protein